MLGIICDSIYILMECDEWEYVLIDMVGVCKCGKIIDVVEKFLVIKMLQVIEDVNVVLLVIDVCEGIFDQDLFLLGFIFNSGCLFVIVVNKWDGLSQEVKEQVKEMLDFCLGFIDFVCVYFIFVLYGSGVGNLFEFVCEVYDSFICWVSIVMLICIMMMVVEDYQLLLVCGCCVKLKYVYVGGYNLLIVVIYGNQVKDLLDFYKCYLMNYFCKLLEVMGMLICIQFKEGENLYVNKCNILMLM